MNQLCSWNVYTSAIKPGIQQESWHLWINRTLHHWIMVSLFIANFHSQSPPPMTGLPLKYDLRWNLLQPVGIKEKHVNNDWMLLILVTVNPLDGLRSAVTKKVAQILTQSNFELHPWKFTCHLKKDHCQKEISATGDIPQSLAAWVKSIPHLKEAKQYPVATALSTRAACQQKNTWWFSFFSFEFVEKLHVCLIQPPFEKKHLKDHFYLSNWKNLLGQRFQEPRLFYSKTLAPKCFLQIKAASCGFHPLSGSNLLFQLDKRPPKQPRVSRSDVRYLTGTCLVAHFRHPPLLACFLDARM